MDSLSKLGNDFKILQTGQKRVICSVSVELSPDNMTMLQVAEENQGWLTFSALCAKQTTFTKDRFQRAIDQMIKEGLAWVDEEPLADDRSSVGIYSKVRLVI